MNFTNESTIEMVMAMKWISILMVMILLAGCGSGLLNIGHYDSSQYVTQVAPTKSNRPSWPSISVSEQSIRKYLSENQTLLSPIEGIWILNQKQGSQFINTFRFAIIRDTISGNYDFVCIVLESKSNDWALGKIKGYFRNTGYSKVYDGIMFLSDSARINSMYSIDDFGVLKEYGMDDKQWLRAYPMYTMKHESGRDVKSTGSGFISPSGRYIITNQHVIDDANSIEVFFPDKEVAIPVKVKISDKKNDLTILEPINGTLLDTILTTSPYAFANNDEVKVGEEIFTIGYPLNPILGNKPRLSSGRIGSKYGLNNDPRLYQIDAPIQPGNSGGPLFNTKGELIGVVVSSLNAKYFYEVYDIVPQNVNFAIKSTYVKALLSTVSDSIEYPNKKLTPKNNSIENQTSILTPFVVLIKTY